MSSFKKPGQYTKKSYFERNFVKIKCWKTAGKNYKKSKKRINETCKKFVSESDN